MQIPNRDGDGYLVDMSDWSPEVGQAMAENGLRLDWLVNILSNSALCRQFANLQSILMWIRKKFLTCG